MENKIRVIKAIRILSSCGLKEAVEMVSEYENGNVAPEIKSLVEKAITQADVIEKAAAIDDKSMLDDFSEWSHPENSGNKIYHYVVTFESDEGEMANSEELQIKEYLTDIGFKNVRIREKEGW